MATWRSPSRFLARLSISLSMAYCSLSLFLLIIDFISKIEGADIGRTFHCHSVNLIHWHCNRCHIPGWRTGWIAAAEKDSNMFPSLCWGWVTVCIMRLFSLTPPPQPPLTQLTLSPALKYCTCTTNISNLHVTVMGRFKLIWVITMKVTVPLHQVNEWVLYPYFFVCVCEQMCVTVCKYD